MQCSARFRRELTFLGLTSGILRTWQKRVRTCLKHVRTTYHVQCYSTSLLRTLARIVHVHTFLKIYVHVHTFSEMYEHVRTVYVTVHGTYIWIPDRGFYLVYTRYIPGI